MREIERKSQEANHMQLITLRGSVLAVYRYFYYFCCSCVCFVFAVYVQKPSLYSQIAKFGLFNLNKTNIIHRERRQVLLIRKKLLNLRHSQNFSLTLFSAIEIIYFSLFIYCLIIIYMLIFYKKLSDVILSKKYWFCQLLLSFYFASDAIIMLWKYF